MYSATLIKESAERQIKELETKQRIRAMLEHSIQSDYLRLRKLTGVEADHFVTDLIKCPF